MASDPALAEPGLPIGEALPEPAFGSTTVPAEQDDPKTPVDPYLTLPDPRPPTSEPATEPVPAAPVDRETASDPVDVDRSPLDLEPEPVAIEESDPLPLLSGEASATEPAVLYTEEETDSYLPYVLGASIMDPVGTMEGTSKSATTNALESLVNEAPSWPTVVGGEGLIDTTSAGLFYGQEVGNSPASEPSGETESSPTGAGPEQPLQDSGPQPVSPFTPPAGSSFSLSGGQVGAGIASLLLCVLASGLILPRREFKLSWAFCELPKPSSVLLLPLERPG